MRENSSINTRERDKNGKVHIYTYIQYIYICIYTIYTYIRILGIRREADRVRDIIYVTITISFTAAHQTTD